MSDITNNGQLVHFGKAFSDYKFYPPPIFIVKVASRLDRTLKTEATLYSRCVTLKNPHSSMAISASIGQNL